MGRWVRMMRHILNIMEVFIMQFADAPKQAGYHDKADKSQCNIHNSA